MSEEENIEDLINGPSVGSDSDDDDQERPSIDTKDEKEKLGELIDDIKKEGNQIYAQVQFPTGGIYDEDENEYIEEAYIKEPSPQLDMMLMDADFSPATIRKIVLGSIEQLGHYQKDESKSKIARLLFKPMLLCDYMYLLMKIRQLTVGNLFTFESQCNNEQCQFVDDYHVKLSKLKYKNIKKYSKEDRNRTDKIERFTDHSWKIHWHFTTNRDQRKLEEKQKKYEDTENGEINIFTSMMYSRIDMVEEPSGERVLVNPNCTRFPDADPPTKEVEGKERRIDAIEYLRTIPHAVKLEFQKVMDDKEPSLKTKVDYSCDECGNKMTNIIFPLDPNFFFPSEIQD